MARNAGPGAPTPIEYNGLKFLIINNPAQATLAQFIKELKKYNAKTVARCCEPTYSTESLAQEGIKVVDFCIDDGAVPDSHIIRDWLNLVAQTFSQDSESCIAVHCIAGLGRAPVLVAIALIENGMKYHAAVEFIRARRRGAINQKQLEFLEKYKPTNKKGKESCSVM